MTRGVPGRAVGCWSGGVCVMCVCGWGELWRNVGCGVMAGGGGGDKQVSCAEECMHGGAVVE